MPRESISIGARGHFLKRAFEVKGCVTLGHASGARWREWGLAFGRGTTAWLAEAQGRWFLSVERASWLPEMASLAPGDLVSQRWHVADRGNATVLAVEGSLHGGHRPGSRYDYADLSGPTGAFATIEQSGAKTMYFTGREVFLDEIGLTIGRDDAARACPRCDAKLGLFAPRIAVCATCSHCDAVLEIGLRGATSALSHQQPRVVATRWRLGTRAAFERASRSFTLVGVFERSAGRTTWTESLWVHPIDGARWLAETAGAFVYALPVGYGECPDAARAAFEHARLEPTELRGWVGESPWHARVGEKSGTFEHRGPEGVFGFERDATEVRATRCMPLSARAVRDAIASAAPRHRKGLPSAKGLATLGAVFALRRARIATVDIPGLDPVGVRA